MDEEQATTEQNTQFKLNLPQTLHRELKIRAAKNVRSLSGEAVFLMQKAIASEATEGANS